ncbi:hypothetical protein OOK58_59075 [Streptomyces sp. NBC_01728]|uniref:hypothetical protein n=1 Tax=unclassified Streptomyces TaxID=2593676 RepID=UPI00225C2F08|nr:MULTISPECIES: hypothetical protein [unclassified Streptomyces]MCX4462413.1 hypothetical protein [Streptomyces sp. NBC_01719]MCX4500843.1 hypothetical protein [Streptomyces sp. NBC_01728]
MNGEQDHQQSASSDPWAPVTVSADEVTEHQQLQDAYQQTLRAAGYGSEQRERYIEDSGLDPEYAACVWDEEVLPAAEAAGAIPESPGYFDPAERATLDVRSAAVDEFWAQHPESDYDVFSNSPENQQWFKQAMTYGDEKARQVLGDQVAEHLLSSPSAAAEESTHKVDDDFDIGI